MNTSMRASRRPSFGVLMATTLVLSPSIGAAQMDPNMQMPMSMPMPAAKPAAASRPQARKSGRKVKPATAAAPATARATAQGAPAPRKADPATMDMSMPMPEQGASPSAPMEQAAMPGMSMAPTQPREPIPPITAADRAAAQPPARGHTVHDDSIQSFTLINRLETWNAAPGDAVAWDVENWTGGDLNRLWLRSEGVRVGGRTEEADVEVLYGRSIATWWDVVAGVRHDFGTQSSNPGGAAQNFAAIGVVGVAPYKFDVEATAYIGQSGQTAARLEAEYETLLTNRLILQPRIEGNFFGKDDARRGIGSGLSTIEAGLRLRYEFTRRFAPYVGVVHEQAFGNTAGYRRQQGNDSNDIRLVAGIRIWF